MAIPAPLIITLHIDDRSARHFTAMRDAHFPPAINYLPAHITLFHQLPGAEMSRLSADVDGCCRQHDSIPVKVTGVRFLGRGVAYQLESSPLAAVRRCLSGRWDAFLQSQDRQPFHPHITVQNRVAPERARQLYQELRGSFQASEILGTGIDFWYYRGGPWEHAAFIAFGRELTG